MIGDCYSNTFYVNNVDKYEISERLKTKHFELLAILGDQLGLKSVFTLPNKQLLFLNYASISIRDENFNLVKIIDFLNGDEIKPLDFAYMKNMFYMTDEQNNCIYKFNLNLTKVESCGSFGTDIYEFHSPIGLCFIKNNLYVCDKFNKRIQIFDVDLNFVATWALDYAPFLIRASYSSIVVLGSSGLFFYDLETRLYAPLGSFKMKTKDWTLNENNRDLDETGDEDNHIDYVNDEQDEEEGAKSEPFLEKYYPNVEGCMSQVGSIFYVVSANPHKKTSCFDADGNLIEEINMDRFGKLIDDEKDGSLFCVNDNLFMVSCNSHMIVRI
jgi:hypothetical protein